MPSVRLLTKARVFDLVIASYEPYLLHPPFMDAELRRNLEADLLPRLLKSFDELLQRPEIQSEIAPASADFTSHVKVRISSSVLLLCRLFVLLSSLRIFLFFCVSCVDRFVQYTAAGSAERHHVR